MIRLRTDCRQTPLAHLTGTDTQDGFPEAEWVLPQHASAGAYTVKDAVTDYLAEIQAEKKPVAVQGTEYVFDAWIPSSIQVEKLTTDRLNRWHTQGRSLQADRDRPPADARRARKATANRILTMLKAALNRAFHTDRVPTDMAWRKVKPFKRVDEAVVRYLTAAEARRLVKACRWRWLSRKRPRAPANDLKRI